MLSGGAAAEVFLSHDDVALLYLFDELFINILHTMCGELRRIRGIQIAGRDDHVRIDIIAVFEYASFCIFH